MKNNWNKILNELSYRVSSGIPDLSNEQHLMKLWDILKEHNWNIDARVELLKNLDEARMVANPNPSPNKKKNMVTLAYARTFFKDKGVDADDLSDDEIDSMAQSSAEVGGTSGEEETSSTAKPLSGEELVEKQKETAKAREKGDAGAGGESASQGENRFCNAVETLDYDKFGEENREAIDKKKEELKSEKLLTDEKELLDDLGYEEPYPDEAYDYLATREIFAEQELARMTDPENQPNVFTSSTGFKKDPKAYMEWMRAAFDGALATQEHLEESRMDTSKGFTTVQSTTEVDDGVQADLEQKANDKNLSKEDRDYYKKQLKDFKKFRKYHDTYVVGQDENGRTFIVSVSNKKSSKLDDPQNNTTPKARFQVMRKQFGEKVAKRVTLSINDGVRRVTTVTDETRKSSTKVNVDDDFSTIAEAATPSRIKDVDARATKVETNKKSKYYGKAPRYTSGKPKKGAEFSCYLEDTGVSPEDYNKMSRTDKLKHMQKYMGADDWHKENGTSVAYEPYSKIFIKVGEAVKKSKGFGDAFWKKNPEAEKALDSEGAQQAKEIKIKEQEAVKEVHQNVVTEVTEADKEQGFPKDGKNGPHTQAYVGTVMEALHFDSYIDMPDEDDDKMLVQMGVVGAKASHIRGCLAEKSGFKIPPGDRDGLKKHLRETCSIEAGTGAIVIKSKDKDGEPTRIADDTWRTAGTSQKVASGFGGDMRSCVKSKVKAARGNPKGK